VKPEHLTHREYLESLRRMTPEERLQIAFELSAESRRQFMEDLRQRFPDASPEEFRAHVIAALLESSEEERRIAAGLYRQRAGEEQT
jgi:hypothetical protein